MLTGLEQMINYRVIWKDYNYIVSLMIEVNQMDEEAFIQTYEELQTLLTDTLQDEHQAVKKVATERLRMNIPAPKFTETLINLILKTDTSGRTRLAAANFMARFASDIAGKMIAPSQFILQLLDIILSDINQSIKVQVGKVYKAFIETQNPEKVSDLEKKFCKRINQDVNCLNHIGSCHLVYQSFRFKKNGIVNILQALIDALSTYGIIFITQIENMSKDQLLLQEVDKFSELFTQLKYWIDDYKTLYSKENSKFLQLQNLFALFHQYLLLFNTNESIISHWPLCQRRKDGPFQAARVCTSTVCPRYFNIKCSIIKILSDSAKQYEYPDQIKDLIFQTLIRCSKYEIFPQFETFISNCVTEIYTYLVRWSDHLSHREVKLQFFQALLLLLPSTERQISIIFNNSISSIKQTNKLLEQKTFLRKMVFCLFKRYIKYFGLRKKIFNDILALLIDTLNPSQNNNGPFISRFKKYRFYHLSRDAKLETLLLVITTMTETIQNDQQTHDSINEFLQSNIVALTSIKTPIVALRLMSVINNFALPNYFQYILSLMNNGKAFMDQGLSIFRKLLSVVRVPDFQAYLSKNFSLVIKNIEMNDSLFLIIIDKLFQRLIRGNFASYVAICNKLRQGFQSKKNETKKLLGFCLNTIEKFIKQERDRDIIHLLISEFSHLFKMIKNNELSSTYYSISCIKIISQMMEKCECPTESMQRILQDSLIYLGRFEVDTILLRSYNQYLLMITKPTDLVCSLYYHLMQDIYNKMPKRPCLPDQNINIIKYHAYILSQIIFLKPDVFLIYNGLKEIADLIRIVPNGQKEYIFVILMTYAYMRPEQFVDFLKQNNICRAYLKRIWRNQPKEMLFKKIYCLAFMELLKVTNGTVLGDNLLALCVQTMKQLRQGKNSNPSKSKKTMIKSKQQIRELLKRESSKSTNSFSHFSHPFDDIDEIDEFRQMHVQINPTMLQRLTIEQLTDYMSFVKEASIFEEEMEQ